MRGVEVVVVGGGVMGSAATWALARSGREVTLVEQFRVGHIRGSSHGRSRIFRFSYDDPLYVRMAQEALPLWRRLEEDAGEDILRTTGGLDTGGSVEPNVEALEACGASYELLEASAAAERYPFLSLPAHPVLYQPDAGVISADRAWAGFASAARRFGADVREGIRVRELAPTDDGVAVVTDDGELRAEVAVVTAGGWAPHLLDGMGIDLPVRVTRETVAFFRADEALPFPTVVDWGSSPVYALPSPGQGIKAGEHATGPVTDPDDDAEPRQEAVDRLAAWVAGMYPTAERSPHLAETCIYTNTDDERFILERHGPIVVGSPCSGHGFKFAPLVGERLAALVSEG